MDQKKDIAEPLIQDLGDFKHTAIELAKLVHLDNHYKDAECKEFPDRVISSGMIFEKFGGPTAIAQSLGTNIKTGIAGTDKDIADRIRVYGKNAFPPPKIKSLFELVMENFDDPINVILLAAACVSVVIGLLKEGFPEGLIEGASIMIALVLIIVVNSGNNWISERRLANLVKLSDAQEVAVLRGSTEPITIDASELVVGDLIKYEAGMKVPCDCIMIEGQDTICSEVDLTGEPDGIEKVPLTEENYNSGVMCTMMAKSLIQNGVGTALVLAVGPNTVAGVITEKTQSDNQPTHLQRKLVTMAEKIGNVGIGCAILTFFSLIFRVALEMMQIVPCGCMNITSCQYDPECVELTFELSLKNRLWIDVLNTVIIAISVIVCAIPEGLPLAVTISLSYSSAEMRKLNNLVRTMESSETMGGANYICSDKTGTLTLNQMTTMACMTLNKVHMAPDADNASQLTKDVKNTSKDVQIGASSAWQTLSEGILWNSSARIELNDFKDAKQTDKWMTKGNVTEQGIIKFFMNDMGGEGCITFKNNLTEENILCLVPFTSTRKRGTIVVRNPDLAGTDQEVRVYLKGAPDMVFQDTTKVVTADGSITDINEQVEVPEDLLNGDDAGTSDSYMGIFERTVKKFANQAYRTILVTFRDMSLEEFEGLKSSNNDFQDVEDRACLETDLTAIGIFGLQDPLRPSIVKSIETCQIAGITVVMCTGDNIDTAIAISKNAGILTEQQAKNEYSCMTGKNFRETVGGLKKNDDGTETVANMKVFRKVAKNLRVLARSSPEDKYLLVTGLQLCEGVVAVTGDGTNDAPALTKADVGFAMGITGTDIAKGASDIILLDDNFSSIVVALKYGRNVYDNVRKFLQFQLSVNVVAMFIVFFGSVILKDSPLNAVQMLWVNLIMDTLGALALATEPPTDDILERQPYKKDNAIVTPIMWRNVFGHAIYQIFALVFIIFAAPGWLCANYWVKCYKYGDDNITCLEWNPFYADSLYQNADTLEWWTAKGLKPENFNKAALDQMICKEYQEKNGLEAECTDAVIADPANMYTPNDFEEWNETQKLLHYTLVFQVFVFLQLFNQINARKLEEGEFNVFSGMFRNCLFVSVVIFTFTIQMVMVEIGGMAVKTHSLNMEQNLICLLVGSFELLWGVIIKFMPVKFFQLVSLDEKPATGESGGLSSSLKRSSTVKKLRSDIQ